ncbi:hypothetical protein F0U64_16815 [Achromobacter xylosoxidans]|uniref:hypothetical protein n=1 Tax=Alcaligenes xylosoxydans xylosoxydans TaxID=85698 RepID=UPI00122F8247|nr:hypothetical protein [Achromobacter xylosoxidans]QEQ23921.1 hypothetical protein F0U64_16815 [Achromobacter xylosoxidans]
MITSEEKQIREYLTIEEITFAVPAQSFAISCSISAEEALPVVTEFALRVAYVCGTLQPEQLQDFFGFSRKETDAVLNALLDERLLQWNEENLELTHYATARFQDSSDNLPRFFKIQDWSAEVIFDLISFNPITPTNRLKKLRFQVELTVQNSDKQSRSINYAEQSFQKNFKNICKKDKAEIYKISAIDAGERFSIPLPCSFQLDLDGQPSLTRNIDDQNFGSHLEISEAITDSLTNNERYTNERFEIFTRIFGGSCLQRYVSHDTFDLRGYVHEVHLTQMLRPDDERISPLLGALYLPRNEELLLNRLQATLTQADSVAATHESSTAEPDQPGTTDLHAIWVAPQSSFWARTQRARNLVHKLDRFFINDKSRNSGSGVQIIIPSVSRYSRDRIQAYQDQFTNVATADILLMNGNLELLVIPGRLICAIFHFHLTHQPLAIPLGLISTAPEHIAAAEELIRSHLEPRLHTLRATHPDKNSTTQEGILQLINQFSYK